MLFNEISFETICNWIVLISAVILASTNIYKFFKKPVSAVQKKSEEEFQKKFRNNLEEAIPEILDNRSEQVKTERHQEYEELLERVDAILVERTQSQFEDIKEIIESQNKNLEILNKSSQDLLRKNILEIYYKNKATRTITETDREYLDDLFKDYSEEGGNGYIKRKYERMIKWDIVPDEDEDE